MTDSSSHEPPPPAGHSTSEDLFDRLRGLGLRRDTDRRWFGGVCAGIAARTGVDPLLIRAAAIALTIAGGVGVPVYLVLWLLLPDGHGTVLAEQALRGGDAWAVVLVVVTALLAAGSFVTLGLGADSWAGSMWVVLPVALVLWLLAARSRPSPPASSPPASSPGAADPPPSPRAPGGTPMSAPTSPLPSAAAPLPAGAPPPAAAPPRPAPRRRRPSGYIGLVSLGLALALAGLGAALAGPLGFPQEPAVLGFAVALAGVSAVVLALGLTGRSAGFSGFLVVALAMLTGISTAAANAPAERGFGDRTWSPTVASLPAGYGLGAGEATLDLTGLRGLRGGAAAPARVDVAVGAGELTITVPPGLSVRVEAEVGVGEIRHERVLTPGDVELVSVRSGDDLARAVTVGDGPAAVLVDVELGLGTITIEES